MVRCRRRRNGARLPCEVRERVTTPRCERRIPCRTRFDNYPSLLSDVHCL